MLEVNRLKNEFIRDNDILPTHDLVEEKKIDSDIIRTMDRLNSLSEKRARYVFHLIVKASTNNFVKLLQAVGLIAPAKVLRETAGSPLFRRSHVSARS